jgi:hypothetical protein
MLLIKSIDLLLALAVHLSTFWSALTIGKLGNFFIQLLYISFGKLMAVQHNQSVAN